MCPAMTLQETPAVECAHIFEFQTPGCRVWPHNCRIEIYQVAVVQSRSLYGTDTMSIVAGRAGNLLLQMLGMLCETFVV